MHSDIPRSQLVTIWLLLLNWLASHKLLTAYVPGLSLPRRWDMSQSRLLVFRRPGWWCNPPNTPAVGSAFAERLPDAARATILVCGLQCNILASASCLLLSQVQNQLYISLKILHWPFSNPLQRLWRMFLGVRLELCCRISPWPAWQLFSRASEAPSLESLCRLLLEDRMLFWSVGSCFPAFQDSPSVLHPRVL